MEFHVSMHCGRCTTPDHAAKRRTELKIGNVLVSSCLILSLLASDKLVAQDPKEYLDYQTFQSWLFLVPDLKNARLCNLTRAGHDLWASGELRVPASTVLHGDFSVTGRTDWVIQLAAGADEISCRYVLIATRRGGSTWQRLLLHTFQPEDTPLGFAPLWNQKKGVIGFDSGIRKRYSSPATMTWSESGIERSTAGYVLEKKLVYHGVRWNQTKRIYEYERYKAPEEWD
jgi:hypothetical protein